MGFGMFRAIGLFQNEVDEGVKDLLQQKADLYFKLLAASTAEEWKILYKKINCLNRPIFKKELHEEHMNVGLDIAAGDGDWGVYFRIGEAF